MQPTIFCSNGYEQYDADIKNILGQFENTVQTSDGITFKLLKPLRAVLVLTQSDYESFKLVARVPLAVELEKADYDQIMKTPMNDEALRALLGGKEQIEFRDSLGQWEWIQRDLEAQEIAFRKGDFYIVIFPEVIGTVARKVQPYFEDIEMAELEKAILRITLIHELGHHYTFSNFDMNNLIRYVDMNLADGVANYFAYQFLSRKEKEILAEKVLLQPGRYRYYFFLRSAGGRALIEALTEKGDYFEALRLFARSVGPIINLNGHTLTVGQRINGALADFSEKGGNVVSGNIDTVYPLMTGYILGGRIGTLVGRYPSQTTIFVNQIENHPDYSELPRNIKLVKQNIAEVIQKYMSLKKTGQALVDAVVAEL